MYSNTPCSSLKIIDATLGSFIEEHPSLIMSVSSLFSDLERAERC